MTRKPASCPASYTAPMTRDELIDRTKRLIVDGERLLASPSLETLRTWLQRSDELLGAAWGSMDRYHLAWLMVGKPREAVRGRPMTPDEEAAYVREVAAQKTSALRMSLDAVERQGMPFRGESGGIGFERGSGDLPGDADQPGVAGPSRVAGLPRGRLGLTSDADDLAERVRLAREQAALHLDHGAPRAPRPERMQR